MTAVFTLCMASLVVLCMPVRANAITKHVFYVSSSDGHVREVYNNNGWHTDDLTADTNGPTTGGTAQITGFFDGSSEHVFYISSSDLHVRELYFFNGAWHGYDLTADTNGPGIVPVSPLTSYFGGHIDHVFYINYVEGDVHELFFNGNWHEIDLTSGTYSPSA